MAEINPGFRRCRLLKAAGLILTAVIISACSSQSDVEVVPRFLMRGWIIPQDEDADASPFAESLRAVVVTTEDEVRNFLNGMDLVRPRGDPQTLFRTDFEQDLILAVYYLWRPLKGDPLSIQGAFLRDATLSVTLELIEDPQGQEFPYLLAPMVVAAVDKAELPTDTSLHFVFLLNGEEVGSLDVSLE